MKRGVHNQNSMGLGGGHSPQMLKAIFIFTRCAYAQGRVKRLSPSIYLFVSKNTAVCCLIENRHEIAIYRSASQFIFFERCLESRTSLLSSAMVGF